MYKILAKTRILGKKVIYVPICHSTNETAKELVTKNRLEEGTIIITDWQTDGQGYRNNRWESEPGKNLTFSLILCPEFLPVSNQFYLSMVIVLGIKSAIEQYEKFDNQIKCKWPNDLYLNQKKLCGILISNYIQNNQLQYSIVGIGLNVNQGIFKTAKAGSLFSEMGVNYHLEDVLEKVIMEIEYKYEVLKALKLPELKLKYENSMYWIGEQHQFETSNRRFKGSIVGISENGKLIVETNLGIEHFANKEITYFN